MKSEAALAVQARVIFALMMREMATRFGRSAGGYIWALLEPAATVLLLTAVFSQISRTPQLGKSFTLFFATGYMAFYVYREISEKVSGAISSNKALLNFPRVTVIDTIIARFILQLLTAIFVTIFVLGGLYLVTGDQSGVRLTSIFISMGCAAFLGLAIGLLNSVLFPYSPTWQRIYGIITRPLFLISGIFFIFESLPRWVREILWWNPLIHVTAMMREGFYLMYDPIFVSINFVLSVGAICLVTGILLLRRLQKDVLEL